MPYTAPSITGESSVKTGRTYAVELYHAVEPGLGIVMRTGNGDDGIGVTTWWAQPLATTEFFNLGLQVEGVKVSAEANILGMDGTGTPLDSSGTLLDSQTYVIIPDLFDPLLGRLPDREFVVRTGPPEADQVFQVLKLADPPDQIFQVKRGPTPPDQVFDVRAITNHQVVTAEPPFIVKVFAEPPNQIFQVKKGPDVPNTIFSVRRGPSAPDDTFQVLIVNRRVVRVSWPVPDTIYTVTTGPDPAPTPDQIFGVSVGGPDAPPIPDPDQIFQVKTGPAIPGQILDVQVVSHVFGVTVQREPFIVKVGPSQPDTIFAVTTGAPVPDQTYAVLVGADPPDQTFDVTIVQELQVDVADSPIQYAVSANGAMAYVFTGNGLAAEENPPLYVTTDQLVTFALQAPGHPFWICSTQTTGGCPGQPAWASYLVNNGAEEGNIRVRFNQPGLYFYNCGVHSMMTGTITVT